ncbi:major allergen Pru ar 1-like [Bidens hawaiensis]|uniref:major allergen Pru ar 1-like n=1 Tax=Bidens hawaiensis TaxID=980011 RepID=UPI00404A36EC
MANATSFEVEFTSSIPASKVFHDFVIKLFEFVIDNIIPTHFGMAITNLEGDGGVGTIKIMTKDGSQQTKYKNTGLDLENFSHSMVMIEGTGDEEYESTSTEMKVIPSANGSSTFISKVTVFKGTDEGEIEFQKEQIGQWFKAFECTVTQGSSDE